MTENYTLARKSFRRPLVLFNYMLNIGRANAQIIYEDNCPDNNNIRLDIYIVSRNYVDNNFMNTYSIYMAK